MNAAAPAEPGGGGTRDVLQRAAAKLEIRQVLATYCRGVDRLDAALIASAYHPDGTDDRGYWRGLGHDYAPVICERLGGLYAGTNHCILNCLIELDDACERAAAETYVVAHLRRRTDEGLVVDLFGGRYVDRLTRRGGRWAIAHRLVIEDWRTVVPLPSPEASAVSADIASGARDPSDPSYAAFAWLVAAG